MSFAKWMSLFGLLLTASTWQYVNTLMVTTADETNVKHMLQVKNVNGLNKPELE